MFRESLGRDASASSNPEPIQEVTLYEIKKKIRILRQTTLLGLVNKTEKKLPNLSANTLYNFIAKDLWAFEQIRTK